MGQDSVDFPLEFLFVMFPFQPIFKHPSHGVLVPLDGLRRSGHRHTDGIAALVNMEQLLTLKSANR